MPAGRPLRNDMLTGLKQGLLMGTAVLALVLPPAGLRHGEASASSATPLNPTSHPAHHAAPAHAAVRLADLRGEPASEDVRRVADWATDSGDHQGLHFVVLDKRNAKVFLFDPAGRLRAATPVLLGSA
ncbi:MAG TPA: hypothetical protein VMS38_18210, partial [Pseudorhodoferax sp.]|nr:hypothetical protein [Pseudorhodoferax sp.]